MLVNLFLIQLLYLFVIQLESAVYIFKGICVSLELVGIQFDGVAVVGFAEKGVGFPDFLNDGLSLADIGFKVV